MKQFSAIVFSLLLIVAQTFAVNGSVSGGDAASAKCCASPACCCVSQSDAPSAPPVESTAPAAAQNQFIVPLVAVTLFTLAAPENTFSSASVPAELRPATAPIFTRNCSFLI